MKKTDNKENGYCRHTHGNFSQHMTDFVHATHLFEDITQYAMHYKEVLKCAKSKDVLVERAYQTERNSRMFLHHSLEKLNLAYDTGMMDKSLDRLKEAVKSKKTPKFDEAIKKAKKYFNEKHPEVNTMLFDTALKHLEQLDIELKESKGELIIEHNDGNGKRTQTHMDTLRKAGALSRVSAYDFFNPGKTKLFPGKRPLFNDETCHHKKSTTGKEAVAHTHDVYERYLNHFTFMKESAYRHARVVETVGQPHLQGKDPVTAIIVTLFAIGAALIIAGVVIEVGCAEGAWSGDVCDIGWWLIGIGAMFGVAGVMCLVDGCTIIIGLAATMAA